MLLFGDVMNIATDHVQGISKEKFKRIYNEATSEPYNFMCLDKTAKHPLKGIGKTLMGCMYNNFTITAQ